MEKPKCDMCHEKDAVLYADIMDGVLGEYVVAHLCDECHTDAMKNGVLKKIEANPMVNQFSVVVSLPKGTPPEPNFGSMLGVIREAKNKSKVPIKQKTGLPVYRFAMNLTKLKAMIAKYPSVVTKDKYGQDTVWLSVFEKIPKASGGQGGTW